MNKLKSNNSKNKGSTLLEALISLAIVSIGALGLINLQSNLIQTKSFANQKVEAMQLAENKIEELRNFSTLDGYDALSTSNTWKIETKNSSNTSYQRYSLVAKYTNPNYAYIYIYVFWLRPNNTDYNIYITSRIAELDPANSGKAMEIPKEPLSPLKSY